MSEIEDEDIKIFINGTDCPEELDKIVKPYIKYVYEDFIKKNAIDLKTLPGRIHFSMIEKPDLFSSNSGRPIPRYGSTVCLWNSDISDYESYRVIAVQHNMVSAESSVCVGLEFIGDVLKKPKKCRWPRADVPIKGERLVGCHPHKRELVSFEVKDVIHFYPDDDGLPCVQLILD